MEAERYNDMVVEGFQESYPGGPGLWTVRGNTDN